MALFVFFSTIILYGMYTAAVAVDQITTEETDRLD